MSEGAHDGLKIPSGAKAQGSNGAWDVRAEARTLHWSFAVAKARSFCLAFSARLKSCPVTKLSCICLVLAAVIVIAGCHATQRDPGTVVVLIESSPANLDPRVGTDAQSERIDGLLFDGLVARDAHFNFVPALAERWEQPDPLTLKFTLRGGVRFHDGRALTAADVAFTIESMLNPKMPGE